MYGGYCGHGDCYHNSLHELNTISLEWTVLAPSEAEGAPMKKYGCGIVVYSRCGEEQLCVFGGYGLLNSASHPTARYEDEDDDDKRGYTNELHVFTSGEHRYVKYMYKYTQCIIVLLAALTQFLYILLNASAHAIYHVVYHLTDHQGNIYMLSLMLNVANEI